jgi:ceramide glucosyltransferase
MSIDAALPLAALVLLIEAWHFHRLQRIALRPAPRFRRLASYPSLTVVRPIKGVDAGARENLRAALDNGYPGPIETIFVLDTEHEPAVPLVEEAIREHRARRGHGTARILFCGDPPPGRTGKLHAMIAGMAVAEGELVAFADSDIRPDRDALARLVETLRSSADAGCAFAPVVVASEPRTAGDAGYALTLNGIYGAAVAISVMHARGELPFVMGQLMVFEREALRAIGGLASVQGQFVDDMYIGARLANAGYRNVVAPGAVAVIQEGLPFREFLRIYRRWIAFSLSGLDRSFTLASFRHNVLFWLALFLIAVAIPTGNLLTVGIATAVAASMAWSVKEGHEQLGGAPLPLRYAWVPVALLIITPLLYPTIFARREVAWRGRTYTLDRSGRLATSMPSDDADADPPPAFRAAG